MCVCVWGGMDEMGRILSFLCSHHPDQVEGKETRPGPPNIVQTAKTRLASSRLPYRTVAYACASVFYSWWATSATTTRTTTIGAVATLAFSCGV